MDLSSINLNLLTALKCLLDEAHVSRAAEDMNITQSAMSKNLAQLREIVNDPILVRCGNRLEPTERAKIIKPQVNRLLEEINVLFEGPVFEPDNCQKKFRIAVTDYVAEYIMPDFLEVIFQEAPLIQVEASMIIPSDAKRLADGELDIVCAIVDDSYKDMYSVSMGQDRFVCCMRPDHPLAVTMTLDDYCNAGHAAMTSGGDKVRLVDSYLAGEKRQRTIKYAAPLYCSVMNVVSRTDLLITLPRHVAYNLREEYDLVLRELPFELEEFSYAVVWHERREHDPSLRWFRSRVIEEFGKSTFSGIYD
ncbi:MAG: LysR family transcriptional regulator [Desulfovibrio sp.]